MSDSTFTLRAEDSPDDAATNTMILPYRQAAHAAQQQPTPTKMNAGGKRPFRTTAVQTYRTHQLASRTWECRVCAKPATQIYHAAASTFSPHCSSMADATVPTCGAARCRTHGYEIAQHFSKTALPESEVTSCGNCGAKSTTALCGGCTFSCMPDVTRSWSTR